MSINRQRPQSRSARRQAGRGPEVTIDRSQLHLPVILRFLTNPKLFIIVSIIFAIGIMGGLVSGIFGTRSATNGDSPVVQANEAADVPRDTTSGTPVPAAAATKRYATAPALTIDTSKSYV